MLKRAIASVLLVAACHGAETSSLEQATVVSCDNPVACTRRALFQNVDIGYCPIRDDFDRFAIANPTIAPGPFTTYVAERQMVASRVRDEVEPALETEGVYCGMYQVFSDEPVSAHVEPSVYAIVNTECSGTWNLGDTDAFHDTCATRVEMFSETFDVVGAYSVEPGDL